MKNKDKDKDTGAEFSKKEVERAGESLITPNISVIDPEKQLHALQVLSYWRACHITPLDTAFKLVESVVSPIDGTAIIAKRLKRAQSIITKLARNKSMALRNMQDIGGVRVICRSIRYVHKIRRELTKIGTFRITDYILEPKHDGYRGIHLIGKFSGPGEENSYLIEIQLRTVSMHNWATSVEIIDLFTNQSLKTGSGRPQWQDFFRQVSVVLASKEGITQVRRVLGDATASVIALSKKLDVFDVFEACSNSLKIVSEYGIKEREGYYLIQINTLKKTLKCNFYGVEAYDSAVSDYLQHEYVGMEMPSHVVALVSTFSISDLKEAYPNYFADSGLFLEQLREVHEKFRVENPNWLRRFFASLTS